MLPLQGSLTTQRRNLRRSSQEVGAPKPLSYGLREACDTFAPALKGLQMTQFIDICQRTAYGRLGSEIQRIKQTSADMAVEAHGPLRGMSYCPSRLLACH